MPEFMYIKPQNHGRSFLYLTPSPQCNMSMDSTNLLEVFDKFMGLSDLIFHFTGGAEKTQYALLCSSHRSGLYF